MKVVFIGAGKVARQMSRAMQKAGMHIAQVYSRSEESARTLACELHAEWTTDVRDIQSGAGLLVFALKDDAIQDMVARIPPGPALWIHTAGSVPIDIFRGVVGRYGVLYPLQTFSKDREVDFSRIPCFIEASSPADEAVLREIAGRLSAHVRTLDSGTRKYLHLAAVFACNFSNHMYVLAGKLLKEHGLPQEVLLPLIDETAAKIHSMSPAEAQTGPALRYDRNTLDGHMALLTDPAMREIYQLISKNIHNEAIHEQYQL
jgi:predicted short-subunit dehydrogenase-like oxidoreductase (DUF2520 family)